MRTSLALAATVLVLFVASCGTTPVGLPPIDAPASVWLPGTTWSREWVILDDDGAVRVPHRWSFDSTTCDSDMPERIFEAWEAGSMSGNGWPRGGTWLGTDSNYEPHSWVDLHGWPYWAIGGPIVLLQAHFDDVYVANPPYFVTHTAHVDRYDVDRMTLAFEQFGGIAECVLDR
jgi:hypothetical protein